MVRGPETGQNQDMSQATEGGKMKNKVYVWDPLVRIFHWGLVLAFIIAYLTAEEENLVHIYSGYLVLGLIIFRVLWGIAGTKYARFSDFIYSPAFVIRYIKGLIAHKPEHYLGHNPLGGWMVVALLLCLFVVTVSGLKVYAIEEGRGPLAANSSEVSVISNAYADRDEDDEYGEDDDDDRETSEHEGISRHGEEEGEEFWEEIHEASTDVMLFLILLHIGGVIFSSYLHRENLVKAMVTGIKEAESPESP